MIGVGRPKPARGADGPASVRVQGLGKRFGTQPALTDVSFGAHGGVVALLGPNGAGKTTLLRCLATVLRPDNGEIYVDGLDQRRDDDRVAIRYRLGYLPQRFDAAGNATLFDVVDYLAIVKGHGVAPRRHAEVQKALHLVGLADRAHTKVRELSGGMKQRLGIAQALLGDPGLVILDEPATGLDPEQRLLLRDRLSRLGERSTVIVSTHLTEEAAAFSQTLHVLDAGRIVYSGTAGGLAACAAGRVWLTSTPVAASPLIRASWRTPDGRYRAVADHAPPGGVAATPTLEDGYLLLVGGRGGVGANPWERSA